MLSDTVYYEGTYPGPQAQWGLTIRCMLFFVSSSQKRKLLAYSHNATIITTFRAAHLTRLTTSWHFPILRRLPPSLRMLRLPQPLLSPNVYRKR